MSKKLILALSILLTSHAFCNADDIYIDSVAVVKNPVEVTIEHQGSTATVTINEKKNGISKSSVYVYNVENDDDASALPFDISLGIIDRLNKSAESIRTAKRQAKKHRISFSFLEDVYFGLTYPRSGYPDFNKVGWQIGMLQLGKATYSIPGTGTQLSLGFGWVTSSYSLSGDMMLTTSNLNVLSTTTAPQYAYDKSAHLNSFSLQFPFTIRQRLYKSLCIEAGIIANLNTYVTAYSTWKIDNVKQTYEMKGLHQRTLTSDLIVRIGCVEYFSFFYRQAMQPLFKKEFGPELEYLSAGFSVGF